MQNIAFVTSNRGKAIEVKDIFRRYGIPLKVYYCETVEIQSEDLAEIAIHRAIQAYSIYREPLFVEDAGLFIKQGLLVLSSLRQQLNSCDKLFFQGIFW